MLGAVDGQGPRSDVLVPVCQVTDGHIRAHFGMVTSFFFRCRDFPPERHGADRFGRLCMHIDFVPILAISVVAWHGVANHRLAQALHRACRDHTDCLCGTLERLICQVIVGHVA